MRMETILGAVALVALILGGVGLREVRSAIPPDLELGSACDTGSPCEVGIRNRAGDCVSLSCNRGALCRAGARCRGNVYCEVVGGLCSCSASTSVPLLPLSDEDPDPPTAAARAEALALARERLLELDAWEEGSIPAIRLQVRLAAELLGGTLYE